MGYLGLWSRQLNGERRILGARASETPLPRQVHKRSLDLAPKPGEAQSSPTGLRQSLQTQGQGTEHIAWNLRPPWLSPQQEGASLVP